MSEHRHRRSVRNGMGPIPQDLLRIFVSGERNKKSKRCTVSVRDGGVSDQRSERSGRRRRWRCERWLKSHNTPEMARSASAAAKHGEMSNPT
jgi:hypothetical protein